MRLIETIVANSKQHVGFADTGIANNQDFHKPVVGAFAGIAWSLLLHRKVGINLIFIMILFLKKKFCFILFLGNFNIFIVRKKKIVFFPEF